MNDGLGPVQILGIPWYKEADYDRLRTLFTDGHRLPTSFLQWQDSANQIRKRYIRQGKVVVQAYIDPVTFPRWFREHGHGIDAKGRTEFAALEAMRIWKEQDGSKTGGRD